MRSKQGNSKKSRLVLEELEQRFVLSTYYVATGAGASDNNAGSSAAPFASLQHAADLVQAGDTVIVKAGNYAGFVMGWDTPTAGTSAAPITFEADPNATAGSVVINARNNKTATGIDLEPGCDWITLEGFTIQGGGAGGIGTYPNKGEGIKVTGSHDSVSDNTISGVDYGFGILADNATDVLIKGNNVSGTGSHGNSDYGHGIYLTGDSPDAVVTGNVIHDNDYIGIHINNSGGTLGDLTGALIAGNLIYNNGQNGINADGILDSTIENNVIYGYASYGICLYQSDAAAPSTGNVIVNNTIVSTKSGAGAAVRIKDAATGNTVLNNILLGGGGIALDVSSNSQSGLVSDYNVSGGTYQNDDTGSTQSLASWQSSTGQDKHSFTAAASALFVNAASNNYHLSSTSPALDAGTATDAPATDFDGNARPQGNGFDIGAYEYATNPTPPPNPGPGTSPNPPSGGGQGSLSAQPSGSASVAFGPGGMVMVLVSSGGQLTQFDAAGVQVLGDGVRSASVAFGPAGEELLVTFQDGRLVLFDAAGMHPLGSGVLSASIGFGPDGEVMEVVFLDGTLRQFDAQGVHVLGSGVRSASVAFGPLGEVLDVVFQNGQLVQFDATGSSPVGGGVLSAGLAYGPTGPVIDVVFLDGSLVQFDAFGIHRLGML